MRKKLLSLTLFLATTGVIAAQASKSGGAAPRAGAVLTSQQIVQRHVDIIRTGNVDGVMADYADDAILVTPPGAFPADATSPEASALIGKANIRKFFVMLADKEHFAAVKGMDSRIEPVANGVTLMRWIQFKGTPQHVDGTDVFVVKNGKITFHAVTVNAPPTK